jgi:hypothetical protein
MPYNSVRILHRLENVFFGSKNDMTLRQNYGWTDRRSLLDRRTDKRPSRFVPSGFGLSIWIRFGRRLLVKILKNHPDACVEMPNETEIVSFQKVIDAKYQSLTNVWGAMDGLKLLLQQAGKQEGRPDVQNYFYNGWTHDHYVSNLFLFSPDGKIRKFF